MEVRLEQGASKLWEDLVAGDVSSFVARAKIIIGRGVFASRERLQELATSYFGHAQSGDDRLAGALEMLAAVLQEPSGLDAVRELHGDQPWNMNQLRNTKLGAVLDSADICMKRPCEGGSNRQGNGDGVWCAVAFAYVVVATRGCPAVVRSRLRMDGFGRAQLVDALYVPIEFLRRLAQERQAAHADTRKTMRQLLHAVWKWWRDRGQPSQQPQPWAPLGGIPLLAEVTRFRGILLEFIVEGAFAAGFPDARYPGMRGLVGSAEELRAGLVFARAAEARNQVRADGQPLEFDHQDWEVCAKACARGSVLGATVRYTPFNAFRWRRKNSLTLEGRIPIM